MQKYHLFSFAFYFFIYSLKFFFHFSENYLKKSPIKPDNHHLHMLSYKFLKHKLHHNDCNYLNSLVINIVYLIIVLPSIYVKENGFLCKYWFFFSIVIYVLIYFRLNSFIKKKIDI